MKHTFEPLPKNTPTVLLIPNQDIVSFSASGKVQYLLMFLGQGRRL